MGCTCTICTYARLFLCAQIERGLDSQAESMVVLLALRLRRLTKKTMRRAFNTSSTKPTAEMEMMTVHGRWPCSSVRCPCSAEDRSPAVQQFSSGYLQGAGHNPTGQIICRTQLYWIDNLQDTTHWTNSGHNCTGQMMCRTQQYWTDGLQDTTHWTDDLQDTSTGQIPGHIYGTDQHIMHHHNIKSRYSCDHLTYECCRGLCFGGISILIYFKELWI